MAWESSGPPNPEILIGVLHTGFVSTQWAFQSMLRGLYSIAPKCTFSFTRGQPFDQARQLIAERSLKLGAKWVLYLDSDVLLPMPNPDLDVVQKLLSHNLPIVSGLYYRRWRPQIDMDLILRMLPAEQRTDIIARNLTGGLITSPAMWRLQPIQKGHKKINGYIPIFDGQFPRGSLVECDVVGAGCLLIRTDVFRHLKKPWFKWTIGEDPQNPGVSEDFYFCEKAKAAGYKILVDSACVCGHESYLFFGSEGKLNFSEI